MAPDPGAQRENQKPGFQKWCESVNAVAAVATPEALSSLIGVFYDQGWAGKERVLSVFRDKPDALVYPVLEQALRDHENAVLRNAAMEIYVALGGRSSPPLLALLGDADEEVRCFACAMLGDLKERGAVPDLIQALSDPTLNVKHAAAEALGKIKDPRAVEPLIEALHTDMWLQFPAAVALGELGDSRAVVPLIELLEAPGANVPAIQALGKIGDPAALGPLCAFLEDDESSLREWALEAVAGLFSRNPNIHSPEGISRPARAGLIETLTSESLKARRNAVVTLGCFRVKEAVSALTRLLTDRELREDALEAIVRIGGDVALGELAAYTNDSDPLVRRAAVEALAGLGTEHGMKAILPLLSDPAEDVRMEAALALSRFDSDEAHCAISTMLSAVTGAVSEAGKNALEAFATITAKAGPPFAFDPEDITPLRDYIAERLGLYYEDERLNVLHHRLSPIAVTGGFSSLKELLGHLIDNPGSIETLNKVASQLTNNETYFFREMEQLKVFVQSLMPDVIQKRLQDMHRKIRILSAGCSSGEEAYTIAMLLEEAGVRTRGCSVEILGIDIDRSALDIGRQGRYPARSFRGGENGIVQKYFRREAGWFLVNESIRGMVHFRQGNILDMRDSGRFDIIFCRNVLIYFSDSTIERVAKNFHRMLMPGGYLLLGHSESFCRINTDFVPVRLEGAVVYQKT